MVAPQGDSWHKNFSLPATYLLFRCSSIVIAMSLLPPSEVCQFADRKAMIEALQTHARNNGYTITIQRSNPWDGVIYFRSTYLALCTRSFSYILHILYTLPTGSILLSIVPLRLVVILLRLVAIPFRPVKIPLLPVAIRFLVGIDPSGDPIKSAGGNTISAGGHTGTQNILCGATIFTLWGYHFCPVGLPFRLYPIGLLFSTCGATTSLVTLWGYHSQPVGPPFCPVAISRPMQKCAECLASFFRIFALPLPLCFYSARAS
jgi:hypothetical protein